MAKIYATLIIKGRNTIDDVPEKLKEAVKEILIERGYPELANPTTEA